jgi:predicted site-specific integrase-resolvase
MVMSGETDSMMSTQEAAERLGVSRQTLLRWFREGRVADTVRRDRNGWREFSSDDIERIRSQAAGAKDK